MNTIQLPGDMPLSVLDTAPIVEGSTARQALHNTLDLALLADELGYRRYWVAEHHGMKGVASCATAVIVSELSHVTRRIRVGAGGVLLPNHPPILIAEQYGTLEALHPGRIDLAVGRGLGGPEHVAELVRTERDDSIHGFGHQIDELVQYFLPAQLARMNVPPATGNAPAIWVLGSSRGSATLAASRGMRYAFGAHLNPEGAAEAVSEYRCQFPSTSEGKAPYVAVAVPVIAAETDSQADWLAGSIRLKVLSRRSGKRIRLPSPDDATAYPYTREERAQFGEVAAGYVIGGPSSARDQLQAVLNETGANELIITSPIFHHAARRRSYEILASVSSRLEFGRPDD